ncbi:MAG: GNAT family N-acetyltransferase [Spirochaetales bacterium]|jgi:ribosomal protein S18 acetylase RimI-like enzyme|nr:GNAT family N-acetyltransferase [Spirochaetales bacterium]
MEVKLSHEIIDQIIFGMENQDKFYVFNLSTCEVKTEDAIVDAQNGEVFISLPEWNSSKGFQLMEKFVANLRNPVYREILRDSLSSGKGVFRKFKNALKEREDIERLWFQYKEREMREYVIEWFYLVKEAQKLESVEVEGDDETTELVLSDFLLVYPEEIDWSTYLRLDREAFAGNHLEIPEPVITALYEEYARQLYAPSSGILRAEAPDGELAGFLWYRDGKTGDKTDNAPGYGRIIQLLITPEYRGLGLARTLIDRYLEDAFRRGVEWVFIEAEGEAMAIAEKLLLSGFERQSAGFNLDLHRWGMENLYS